MGDDGELAQGRLPPLASEVDEDREREDYGQPTGGAAEPDRSIGKFRNEKSCFCHFQLEVLFSESLSQVERSMFQSQSLKLYLRTVPMLGINMANRTQTVMMEEFSTSI